MSYHPEWASRSPFLKHPPVSFTSDFERKVALAAILLVLGALVVSVLDSWPSTTKRLIWEGIVFLTPARLVYTIEYATIKYNGLPDAEPKFRPEHFGDHQAKVEAIRRILHLDDGQFTTTFRRVRPFSGINKIMGRSQAPLPSGLGNWDNSCYQNSVLQGLASLPAFRAFTSSSLERMSEQDEAPTHLALQDIVGRLNATEHHSGTLWTPSALKSMDSWQQQDAQEYFSKLMDTVDKEIAKSVKRRKLRPGFEAAAQPPRRPQEKTLLLPNPLEGLLAQRVACKQCGHAEGLSLLPFNCLTINMGRQHEYDLEELLDEHTALEDIEGVECIKCTLLHAQSQLERLLSKPAVSDASDESANASMVRALAGARLAAIQKVFDDDSFSDNGILKRCSIPAKNQVSSVKSKQVALARPPKNLVIHINRSIFDDFGNQRKNTASIHFPLALDIGRWCLGVKSSSAEIKEFEHWSMTSTESLLPLSEEELLTVTTSYELRCVVTHYGRHENGHYVAYGKRQSRSSAVSGSSELMKDDTTVDQWYCFNDEAVTVVSEDDVLERGNVFMLFYESVDRPQDSTVTADQTVTDAPMKITELDSIGSTEEPAVCAEKIVEEDALENVREGNDAKILSGHASESAHDQSENDMADSCTWSEEEPITGPYAPSTGKPPTGSGLAPVMRTSSASPTLSRMDRHESNLTVPSSSIISAV